MDTKLLIKCIEAGLSATENQFDKALVSGYTPTEAGMQQKVNDLQNIINQYRQLQKELGEVTNDKK